MAPFNNGRNGQIAAVPHIKELMFRNTSDQRVSDKILSVSPNEMLVWQILFHLLNFDNDYIHLSEST